MAAPRFEPQGDPAERMWRLVHTGEMAERPAEVVELNRKISAASDSFWERNRREEQLDRVRSLSEINARFEDRTFENFRHTVFNAEAHEAALAVAADPTRKSLGVYGSLGNGKTHLAGAIVNKSRAAGIPAVLISTVSLLMKLQACNRKNSTEDEAHLIERYASVPVLALDDLGKERLSPEWAPKTFYALINERYERKLPLIVTSNAAYSILLSTKYALLHEMRGNEGLDKSLGPSIIDRIREMTGPWIENKAPGERGRAQRDRRRSERTDI
jgi:DNA replication protein DnaC